MGRSLNETLANVKCFSITLYALEQYRPVLSAKLEFAGKDRQVTNYDRQVVEHGDCVAYSVAGATVHAPRLKARAVAAAKCCHLAA